MVNEETVRLKKILIIDDHHLFREGLMSLFQSTDDFLVVGGAGSVHEGIQKAFKEQPDLILMDFSLPDGTGLDATRAIMGELPNVRIVFLTISETDENLFAALRAGASGYLLKNVTRNDLIASLRALDKDEMALSRKMMSKVVVEFSRTTHSAGEDSHTLVARLSPREVDILREIESGATNYEIARRLFLSENTVKHHIRNVLDKLGVENRRMAAAIARQNGLRSKSSQLE